jgi:hypothetical protein
MIFFPSSNKPKFPPPSTLFLALLLPFFIYLTGLTSILPVLFLLFLSHFLSITVSLPFSFPYFFRPMRMADIFHLPELFYINMITQMNTENR